MKFKTLGPLRAATVRAALDGIRKSWGDSVQLGIVYFPFDIDPLFIHDAWKIRFKAPLVGASTAGVAFTERGMTSDEIVLGVFADADIGVSVAERLKSAPVAHLDRAIRAACQGRKGPHAVLVLTDPFSCDGEDVVSALRKALPAHTRACGASAGDGDRFIGVKLLSDGRVFDDAVIFVAISFPTRVEIDLRHGFSVHESAREMVVTSAVQSQLLQLDGHAAEATYNAELRRLGWTDADASLSLLQSSIRYSIGLRTPFGEGLIIRTPLRSLPGGGLQLSAGVSVGQRLTVVTTTPDQIIESAAGLRQQMMLRLRGEANGLLVFECGGRAALLGRDFEKVVAAWAGPGDLPVLGMTGYGEIAKFGGSMQGFHNISAIVAGW